MKKLDAKLTPNQEVGLRGAAIFLNFNNKRDKEDATSKEIIETAKEKDELVSKLKDRLATWKQLQVGIDNPNGPANWGLAKKDYVTVVLYDKYRVKKCYIFTVGDKGEAAFDATAITKLLAAIDSWTATLPKK